MVECVESSSRLIDADAFTLEIPPPAAAFILKKVATVGGEKQADPHDAVNERLDRRSDQAGRRGWES